MTATLSTPVVSAEPSRRTRRRVRISTALGLGLGGLPFFLTLFDWAKDPTRTALAPGYFSHFFDLQARALLDGRLAVPEGSLGIEGFLHDGKTYTYFPPWPALLRLPVLMTTHEYDARLTLISMALAWVVIAVMLTKLVWLLLPMLTGTDEVSGTRAAGVVVFLAGGTGGTFITYDAGLPWVYHEVYMWAVASAIGALYWMVRVLRAPDRTGLKWLFVFGLLAVGSRATEGWAVCLTVIAMALWWRFRGRPDQRRWWRWLLVVGMVPLAVSITINELKFGTIYMFPLQDQVWTTISEQRRDALAANGGTLTGPQFFTTSFMAYFRPDGIRFVDVFPWITLPADPAPSYNGAVVDQSYRTGSVTAFMPLFLLLEIVALVAVFRPRVRPELRMLRWPMTTGVLITGGVMGYGYYSTRYASEFVPALTFGAAVATCLIVGRLERRRRWRVPVLATMGVLVAFSIVAQTAIGFASAAYIHRGDPLERYLGLQLALTPDAQAARVSHISGLPEGGRTDDIAISGDCQALYLHTGDQYEPWLPVEERDRVLRLTYDVRRLRPGSVTLFTVTTTRTDRVDLQVDRRGRVRLVLYFAGDARPQLWFDPPTDGGIDIGIRNRIDFSAYEVESRPGGTVGYLASVYLDDEEDSLPAFLDVTRDSAALKRLGFQLVDEPGLPLDLCHRIAEQAGIDLAATPQ